MARKPQSKKTPQAPLKGVAEFTRPLSSRLLYLVMALVTAAILVGGYLFYHDQERQMRQRAEYGLSVVAQLKMEQIVEWRAERLVDANMLVGSPFFAEGVERYLASPADTEAKSKVLAKLAVIAKAYPYRDILLTDVNGNALLSLHESVRQLSDVTLAQMAVAFNERKAVITDFHLHPVENTPHLDVIAPLFPWGQDSPEAIGAVVFFIEPSHYLYPLLQSFPMVSETAETLLVERDGDNVLFLNELRHQKDTALRLKIPLSRRELPSVMAVMGKEGIVQGRDYRGVEVVATLKRIPDSPWYLVAKIDASEALAAWRFEARIIMATAIGLLVAALAFIGLIWQRRQRLAYQALYQAEMEQLQSERKYRVLTEQTLFGIVVLQDFRIVFANDAFARISGYSVEELLSLPPEKVQALVHSDDQALVWGRFRDRLAGKEVPPQYEYRGIRKDGTARWLEMHASVIDYEGKPAVQAAITDITDRKQAEETAKRLNLVLRAIRDVNQLITKEKDRNRLLEGICRCLTEERGYLGAWVALLDESSRLVAHAESGFGESFLPVVEQLKQGKLPPCGQQAMSEPGVVTVAAQSTTCAGCPLSAQFVDKSSLTVRLRYNEKVYGLLSTDIPQQFVTEEEIQLFHEVANDCAFALYDIELQQKHLATEDALRRSEQNFRDSIENSPLGVRIITADGETLYINRALLDIWGYGSLEELEAVPRKERYTPESYAEHRMRKDKRGRGEFVPSDYEISIVRRDGGIHHLAVSRGEVQWNGKRQFQVLYHDITERRAAEEALRQSEEKYRTILDEMDEGYYEQDLAGNFTFVNDAICRLFGYARDELIGMNYRAYVVDKDAEDLRKEWNRVYRTGEPFRWHPLEIVKSDGRHVLVENSLLPLRNDKGEIIGFRGISRDITERKRAEEALRAASERLEYLLSSSSAMIYSAEVHGNYAATFIGANVIVLTGYESREFVENPDFWYDHVHPDDRQIVATEVPKLFEKDFHAYEYRFRCKGGEYIWVRDEMKLVRDEKGNPVEIIGVWSNITERKQTEESLRESEEKYRTILSKMEDSYFEVDLAGNLTFVNEATCRSLGYSREELLGMNYRGFTVEEDIRRVYQAFNRVYTTGKPDKGFSWVIVRKDGSRGFVEATISLVRNEKGEIVGFRGVGRDITERKKAEEHRHQLELKAQVSSRLASVGEMSAGVAHEINNPLTAVTGYAQLLLDRKDVPADVRKDLEAITEGARRVAGIVQRLLAFSRQTKPERKYVDINHLIESTLVLRAYHLRTNNIKVTTSLAPDLPQTVADPGQIQQVILNLIVNAEQEMKLAHGKGKLTISTEKSDSIIKISVKDDGPGIKPEIMDRLFDPFFTTREVGEGTGLGLSLCYGIVAEHNGKIYAESKTGKGATFIVELPVVTEIDTPDAPEPAADEPERVGKARILVVDDEQVIRDLAKRILTGEGYKVDTVDNAKDALKMIEGKRYNLLLLDIKMPGMDGVQLYRRLEKIAKSLAKRVVFVTGDVMSADTDRFLTETRVAHIAKPFDAAQLKKEVKRALSEG
ncbi:MAG: PAS domain S-box protein [Chloroflexi bacterium]|nr:PAS domain S-box protein [Chloroflexota bacterium]